MSKSFVLTASLFGLLIIRPTDTTCQTLYSNAGPITISNANSALTNIDVGDGMTISMDIKINSFSNLNQWPNIFIIGSDPPSGDNDNFQPGLWLRPESDDTSNPKGFHIAFSEYKTFTTNQQLQINTIYSTKIEYTRTNVKVFVDGVLKSQDSKTDPTTQSLSQTNLPVYVSEPNNVAVDGTVSNLVIKAGTDCEKCPFEVLSVDHVNGAIGQYFNFDLSTVNNILGTSLVHAGIYNIFNRRTQTVTSCAMWTVANGGSIGDAHGRINPKSASSAGDWQTGDILEFNGIDVYCITNNPTQSPSNNPTKSPSNNPTKSPSNNPTESPTDVPTPSPTLDGCDFDINTYLDECYCDGTLSRYNFDSAKSNSKISQSENNEKINQELMTKNDFNQFKDEYMANMKILVIVLIILVIIIISIMIIYVYNTLCQNKRYKKIVETSEKSI